MFSVLLIILNQLDVWNFNILLRVASMNTVTKDIMRNKFTILLAGIIIEIDTITTGTCVLCRDYLYEGKPDCRIKISKEDIDQEWHNNKSIRHNKVSAETTAVFRKIANELINYNILLMHGAVISLYDNAYMFSAPSGTGKTTHIKLWLQNAADTIVINGDKPLIKVSEKNVLAYGSPWSGSENMNSNTAKPLRSIVLLVRSERNHIEKVDFSRIYPFLLQQTYIPNDASKAKKALSLLSALYQKVSLFRFECNNYKDDCFNVAYKALVSDIN